VQRQEGVASAIKANEKISKIPAKTQGGGKRKCCLLSHAIELTISTGKKQEALQAIEDARAAQEEATKSLASLQVQLQTQSDAMAQTDNQTGAAGAASAPAGSDSISQPAAPEEANTKGDTSAAAEPTITPVAQVDVPAVGDVIMDDIANPKETVMENQEKGEMLGRT
jgi:hypothetical protein